MGGGTVLGARWDQHRRSYDIDLNVGDDAHLYLLGSPAPSHFTKRMASLG